MNYLQLCQRVRQEAGISGSGPTTVTGQQGQLAKIVEWVNAAWLEIQTLRSDWLFMWSNTTIDTIASEDTYSTSALDIKTIDTLRIYEKVLGASDENELVRLDFTEMRRLFKTGVTNTGRPTAFSIKPDRAILLNPTPVEIYTLDVDYYRKPQYLTANADTPLLPEEYHDAIVYKALMMFGAHYEATIQYQHAAAQFEKLINQLEYDQLSELQIGGPLS